MLLLAACSSAQVLEVKGGQSTLMGGAGGEVTAYMPSSTLAFGLGTANGHLVFGLSDSFKLRGLDVVAGDSSFGYSVESVGGAGIQVRGLSIQHSTGDRSFAAFLGATGSSYSLPFLSATTAQHAGGGIFYRQRINKLTFSTLAATDGGKRTGLGALSYAGGWWHFSGGGGILSGQKTATAVLDLQPVRQLHFSAMHQDIFWKEQRAQINSASASAAVGIFSVQASALMGDSAGHAVRGQSAGAGVRIGPVAFQTNVYQANGERMLMQGAVEHLRHWQASQSVSESAGHKSFAFGGGYQGNRFAISIGHSVEFLPFGGRNFQQVTSASVSLRLPHDSSLTMAACLLPTGPPLYSVSAGTFTHGPLEVKSQAGAARARRASSGRWLVAGVVVDDKSGMPVSGAAVSVGGQLVYTDAGGNFSARFRKATPVAVRVSVDDFAAPGTFHIVDAPASATPASAPVPLRIIVGK